MIAHLVLKYRSHIDSTTSKIASRFASSSSSHLIVWLAWILYFSFCVGISFLSSSGGVKSYHFILVQTFLHVCSILVGCWCIYLQLFHCLQVQIWPISSYRGFLLPWVVMVNLDWCALLKCLFHLYSFPWISEQSFSVHILCFSPWSPWVPLWLR